ncbi:peptidoglycan DD-metalloendopeptidase family protein [Defluviitalea raffinosedens]|uniref:Peptidoglycan DD-metalloendopeptidase family protein n=1 Tax=Defluviitalea raffinosedens TaxID=1450156 RepID=A0A7C8LH34_9FIRM|nr:peptidoglycan DD-metalloendopeptidase family protein [Defluviitalea raffinosedens]
MGTEFGGVRGKDNAIDSRQYTHSVKKETWINPVEGIITSCFGERKNPVLNKNEFHDGIDIGAEQNEKIVAVKSGIVLSVKSSRTYGNILKYEVVDGYVITYAHCNEIFVKEGEKIKQGQIVASVGSTGMVTGPHLHYGISKNGKFIDPIKYTNLPILEEALE